MRLDSSVPKIKPADGGAYGGGGLSFCSVEEGASRFLRGRAGKVLALAEDSAFSAMLPAVRLPRAVSVLWEGDALPLFAMPEVSGVLAAGGKEVLQAARFFAAVRGVSCALFPAGAALDGAFSPRGEVSVNANRIRVPLSPAEVFCDCAFLRGSLSEGYARLMLSRLALFEARAVGLLCRRPFGGAGYEEAFSLSGMTGELPPEEIVRRNARLRVLEDGGVPRGEGIVLGIPAYESWRLLLGLYLAFFAKGKPRRYAVPDYAARALRLERVRGELLAELRALAARKNAYERALRTYGVLPAAGTDVHKLKTLPERAEGGLSSVIRDFGLMDF